MQLHSRGQQAIDVGRWGAERRMGGVGRAHVFKAETLLQRESHAFAQRMLLHVVQALAQAALAPCSPAPTFTLAILWVWKGFLVPVPVTQPLMVEAFCCTHWCCLLIAFLENFDKCGHSVLSHQDFLLSSSVRASSGQQVKLISP